MPGKNIKPLLGKPLIAYTLEAALESRRIERLIVSTEDPEIADVATRYGGEVPFVRPTELALDHVTDLPVFQHCLAWLDDSENYRPEIVVHLRPTAPLRTSCHIDDGIELLLNSPEADSVRSVSAAGEHPLKMWALDGEWLTPFVPQEVYQVLEAYNQPRQELPKAFVQNGAVDVIRRRVLMEANSMSGSRIKALLMEEIDSVNIDSPQDWALAEMMIASRAKENTDLLQPRDL